MLFLGGTKEGELQRSAELFLEISHNQGAFLALYFIYDCQYGRDEIKRVLEIIESKRS